MFVCLFVGMDVSRRVRCVFVFMWMWMCVPLFVCVCVLAYVRVRVHVLCACTYIHSYTNTYPIPNSFSFLCLAQMRGHGASLNHKPNQSSVILTERKHAHTHTTHCPTHKYCFHAFFISFVVP